MFGSNTKLFDTLVVSMDYSGAVLHKEHLSIHGTKGGASSARCMKLVH